MASVIYSAGDTKHIIEALEQGDYNDAMRRIDGMLQASRQEDLRLYYHRLIAIIYAIITCGEKVFKQKYNGAMLVDLLREGDIDKIYSEIERQVRVVCSAATYELSAEDDRLLKAVIQYISVKYVDPAISVGTIATTFNYSVVHLNGKMREAYGATVNEYLTMYRVEKAKSMLMMGVKISQIAENIGFANIRTFNRAFQKIEGLSPTEYKNKRILGYIDNKTSIKKRYKNALDYGIGVCDGIMKTYYAEYLPPYAYDRIPQEAHFTYHQGVFLSGMNKIYELSKNERYYEYIAEWIAAVCTEDGIRKDSHGWVSLECLDFRQPGVLFGILYKRTKNLKYLENLKCLVESLDGYPRNKAGGFYHNITDETGMYAGDLYMIGSTACMYAELTGKTQYYDMVIEQMEIIYEHMCDENGLLHHAWHYAPTKKYYDMDTGRSKEVWGRAMAFYMVAVVDMLDYIQDNHPKREFIIATLNDLVRSVSRYQAKDGRWYQIIDKGDKAGNWLENSATCLFLYTFAKAYRKGYIDDGYIRIIKKGYEGVIASLEITEANDIFIKDICVGSGVGDYDYYIGRIKYANDLHGAGAFTLMCSELARIGF